MRLLIVGKLDGQLGTASQIAVKNGAQVTHADDETTALNLLRSKGADLVLMDIGLNIKSFIEQFSSEHISTPVIACGIGTDADAAVEAIKSGAS